MSERRNKVILAVVVGFLMTFSVVGFAILSINDSGSGSTLYYNSYKFTRQPDGTLLINLNGKETPFTYFPAELESIQADPSAISKIKNTRMAYVTSDYYANLSSAMGYAEFSISQILKDQKGIFIIQGFIQNATSLPVVSCKNSTDFVPVISFEEGNATRIYELNKCIIVESGSEQGFLMARDRFLYSFMGVMDGK